MRVEVSPMHRGPRRRRWSRASSVQRRPATTSTRRRGPTSEPSAGQLAARLLRRRVRLHLRAHLHGRRRQQRHGRRQGHRADRRDGPLRGAAARTRGGGELQGRASSGEWRISALPETFGTWLSRADLQRLYDPFRIYYVSTGDRRMVPDVRWLPLGTGLATRLARVVALRGAGVPERRGAQRHAGRDPAGRRRGDDRVGDREGRHGGHPAGQRPGPAAEPRCPVPRDRDPGARRRERRPPAGGCRPAGAHGEAVEGLVRPGLRDTLRARVKPLLRVGSALVPVNPVRWALPVERDSPPAAAPADAPARLGLPRVVPHRQRGRRGGGRPGPAGAVARHHPGPGPLPRRAADASLLRPPGRALGGRPRAATTKVWTVDAAADPGDAPRPDLGP